MPDRLRAIRVTDKLDVYDVEVDQDGAIRTYACRVHHQAGKRYVEPNIELVTGLGESRLLQAAVLAIDELRHATDARARVAPPGTTPYDLEKAFENDAQLEQLYARGGTLANLLARLGAYRHHPTDESSYHDERGYGFPTANMRKDRIPLDPSLPFSEYERLIPCGPRVRALVMKHPSTPADVKVAISNTGDLPRTPLDLTPEEIGTRPTYIGANARKP